MLFNSNLNSVTLIFTPINWTIDSALGLKFLAKSLHFDSLLLKESEILKHAPSKGAC